jgi:hypothetical protein
MSADHPVISQQLVELGVCGDPLCGESVFRLIESHYGDFFIYETLDPMDERSEILRSKEQLTTAQIYRLLDETNWFDSDIALQSAEIYEEQFIPRLLDGEWPLFTVRSTLPLAEQRLREWIERWIAENRES